ncbi:MULTISPECIES: hypothetical protein [Sphingobacterium]|jgi:hypothetical protein|uniref:hypothetical protein n=1 Tax=Sphingobacterium TaxID=28453 RepID=UPI000C0C05F3|nr:MULTISPECIES: hypothetical protein [Sphingobacterium]MCT1532841.1 hypothetical protein [Sphingobacterium daejeonense]
MKRNKIETYVSPRIVELKIELEQGILASSATFTPGDGTDGNYTPEVDDWYDSTGHQEIEL